MQLSSRSLSQRPSCRPARRASQSVSAVRVASVAAAEKVAGGKSQGAKAKKRDFVHLDDFSKEELMTILDKARDLKQRMKTDTEWQPLRGKTMSMIFAKPSLRTRVSFESVRTLTRNHRALGGC